MNIDDMAAGEEMDRLVAEKVMGWRYETSKSGWVYLINKSGDSRMDTAPPGFVPPYMGAFSPSTNIAHAWELIDAKKAWEPRVGWNDEQHCWFCDFEKMPIGNSGGDAAPLAICRAALKAIMSGWVTEDPTFDLDGPQG